jgi:hypothetical protein
MTKQEQLQRFDDLVAKLRKTLEDKGHDYASEDVLSNFKDSGKRIGKTPQEQCLSLISTKVSRLSNLLSDKKKTPKNEAIQDSILDLIGYSFLLDCIIYEKTADIEGKLMEAFRKKQQDDLQRMNNLMWGSDKPLRWVDIFETPEFKEQINPFPSWEEAQRQNPRNIRVRPFMWEGISPNSFKTPEQVLREGLEREIEKLQRPPINTQQNFDDMTKVVGGPESHLHSLNIKDFIIDQPKDVDCEGNVSSVTDKMKPFQTLSNISSEMTTKLQEEREEILKDLVGDALVLAMFRPLLSKKEFLEQHRALIPRIERVIQIEKQLGLNTTESEKILQEIKEKTK